MTRLDLWYDVGSNGPTKCTTTTLILELLLRNKTPIDSNSQNFTYYTLLRFVACSSYNLFESSM